MTNQQKRELLELTRAAHLALSKVQNSPLFFEVEYSPDLTISDGLSAIEYLAWELAPDPLEHVHER
ncbi:hypothetical protein [Nodularia chucula]|uniref:hypothetical protein n=1 Tax=Nodularia chucula TaxID=3093667 RepID=UPI0039C6694C